MRTRSDTRRGERGQMIVLMAVALIVVVAVVALIIDGGNVFARQRIVQNGSDAAAESGAVIMAERFAGMATPAIGWDKAVQNAINASAAANSLTVTGAYYTDICGIPLKADGSAALLPDNSYDFASAQRVGYGLPATTATTPNCPSHSVGPAAGVLVLGHADVRPYFAGIVGIGSWSVGAQATAASGYLQDSGAGALLPIAIPVNIVTCDGSNNPIFPGGQWSADGHTVYKVPMCKNGPGNIGWLDWTPPSGGTSELIQEILHPNNPPIPLPSWQFVTSTGDPNAAGVEAAIRTYDGRIVMIPQFDLTCNPGNGVTPDSTSPAINTSPNFGCPAGDLGGNGQNQWYRMPSFANFQLCSGTDPDCAAVGASNGAYINGNNKDVCDTGNGATSCLVGKFVSIISTGTIGTSNGGGTGTSKKVGVQLVK